MPIKFALPLGQPDPTLTASAAEQFRQSLPYDGVAFRADHVAARYIVANSPLSNAHKQVVAMYQGMAFFDAATSRIELRMTYRDRRALEDALGRYLPIPVRLSIGPVVPRIEAPSAAVDQGGVIADLSGDHCDITLQDQDGFYLSPIHWFQLLNLVGFWDIPASVRCPLIPTADLDTLIGLAGRAVATGQPFISIQGGSHPFVIHAPPARIGTHLCSFLSSDSLEVALHNQPTGALAITDQTSAMYRTAVSPPKYSPPDNNAWSFVPQDHLKPSHKPYQRKVNGKLDPGDPLTYRIDVQPSGGAPTISTTVAQDMKDIIRQEYLFHNAPFQSYSTLIDIPDRHQIERNRAPDFARFFSPREVQKSNYDARDNNWLINVDEVYKVAEFMRRANTQRLIDKRLADDLSDRITSFSLKVNSSWRNPERNEKVDGVRKSNHQFGRALDLVAAQFRKSTTRIEERKTLKVELFGAGRDFLEQLIALNGASACSAAEVLLERNSSLLWQYKSRADGTIESKKGGAYQSVVGSQPAGEAAAIRKAAGKASHVHIGWKPTGVDALTLPDILPYDYGNLTQVPTEFRNLILIASEHGSVEAGKQLPLNHMAATLKRYLETLDPSVQTEIREVDDPIEYLAYLNAFRRPEYNINYFFSLSHAWNKGLTLLNFDGDDIKYQDRDEDTGVILGPEIHDAEVFQDINWFSYDPHMAEDTGFDFSEDRFTLEVGENDETQVRTDQLRISNLTSLLPECKEWLKRTFAQSKGIFILGCKAAGEADDPDSSFCETLATVIQRPVYGASYYSKVFQFRNSEWEEIDLTRADPAPPADQPVLLIPGSLGGRQLIKHVALNGEVPDVTPPPDTLDLLQVFKTVLRRCDPKVAE